MFFLPLFMGINLVLSIIGVSGSFFPLPFPFSCSLATGLAAVLLVRTSWICWLNLSASLASEGFHGNGFLKRDYAMDSKYRAKKLVP